MRQPGRVVHTMNYCRIFKRIFKRTHSEREFSRIFKRTHSDYNSLNWVIVPWRENLMRCWRSERLMFLFWDLRRFWMTYNYFDRSQTWIYCSRFPRRSEQLFCTGADTRNPPEIHEFFSTRDAPFQERLAVLIMSLGFGWRVSDHTKSTPKARIFSTRGALFQRYPAVLIIRNLR